MAEQVAASKVNTELAQQCVKEWLYAQGLSIAHKCMVL